MGYAKIRSEGIILVPQPAANALPGELYRDSANADTLTDQSTGGSDTPIGASSSDSLFTKIKKNTSFSTIPDKGLVALRPDGGIGLADSDGVNSQIVIGIAAGPIAADAFGSVRLFAPNIAGALAGLSFTPGQELYLNQSTANGGYTANPADLTDDNDSIVSVGYADCATGLQDTNAVDLIGFNSVIARP